MSTLLEQASLVMIPSGYKEDVVYSQIPTSGAGDLSFTRASNGTRVNSAGLVEVVPWNLLQSSETFNLSPWSTNAGATITSTTETAPNGTATADLLSASTSLASGIYQVVTGNVIGQVYTASLYVKNNSGATSIKYQEENCAAGILFNAVTGAITGTFGTVISSSVENVGNGWYRIQFAYTSNATTNIFIIYSTLGTANSFVLWGAQLNIGSTAKPYFPTTDRLNVPRLTYQNGGGGCPSLLLEKQSTNLVTYSNDATQQGLNNMSATANTATSPDGTQNADTITPSAGTSDHYLITGGASVSSGVIFTASVFVKKKDSDYLYFGTGGAAAWGSVAYRFSTNTFFNVGGGVTSYNATDMGNGWIRLTNTGTTGGTDLRILLTPSDSSGARTFNANGTDGLYIWGLQIEQSSYVTSVIQTTSSSATRVADACFKTGISSLIGQTEGVIYMDFVAQVSTTAQSHLWIGVAGNEIGLYGNTQFIFYSSGGVSINGGSIVTGQRYKIAFAYKANDYVAYVNGVQKGTDTSATVPTTSAVYVNSYSDFTEIQSKQVNEVVLFPTRLTNAELASLTTL